MMTLEVAWSWYLATRRNLKLFGRLGEKHWDGLPWDGALGRDERLRTLGADAIVEGVRFCLEPLDDLAVLVLFSAFESIVRDRVVTMIEREIARERDGRGRSVVIGILDDARRESRRGRVFRLLRFFKTQDPGLVEEVNQVRRFRNWVIHGRRTVRPAAVDPALAYERLTRFLDRFALPAIDDPP
jgi:hypothetical protein